MQEENKWLSQHDKYECGPVAIFNLCRLLNVENINYHSICVWCQCNNSHGTLHDNIQSTINKVGLKCKCWKHVHIKDLATLENPAIISYFPKNAYYGHYSLIIGYVAEENNRGNFHCINWYEGPLDQNVGRPAMVESIRTRAGWPRVWEILGFCP